MNCAHGRNSLTFLGQASVDMGNILLDAITCVFILVAEHAGDDSYFTLCEILEKDGFFLRSVLDKILHFQNSNYINLHMSDF